jgi:hypothetical protein
MEMTQNISNRDITGFWKFCVAPRNTFSSRTGGKHETFANKRFVVAGMGSPHDVGDWQSKQK